MDILFDKINISLIITAFLNLGLGFIIFFNGPRKKINFVYSLNIVAIISWILGMIMYRLASQETGLFWCTVLYVAPTLIASSFLYFTYIFPSQKDKNVALKTFLIFLANLALIAMVIWPGLVIKQVNVVAGAEKEILFNKWYWFYFFYISGFFSYGFLRLFRKYRAETGIEKLQVLFLLSGYALAANLAFVTNLIMPWLGFFFLNWLGQIFAVVMVGFTTYAILKHNLMNIKVIATEIFSVLLVVTITVEMLAAKSFNEFIYKVIIFLAVLIFTIMLIRAALKDVRQKEELQAINTELKKNAKQLEKTNVHLKKLMQMRSEFLDIASHQLKTPVSVILGTISMFKEGSMAKLPQDQQDKFVDNIFRKAKKLSTIISDILRASEMDTEEFRLGPELLKPIQVEEVIKEVEGDVRPEAQAKGLVFEVIKPAQPTSPVLASADYLEQAIFNLVDNAVKYTEKGYVKITLSEERGKIIIKIEDSGIGVSMDDQKKMFEKFGRAKNAVDMYTDGSGLGLFIVKKIITAHQGGQISFTSEQNKGTTFTISLPTYKINKK